MNPRLAISHISSKNCFLAPSINLRITENCKISLLASFVTRKETKIGRFSRKYVNASIRLFVSQAGARRVQCRFEINRGREEIARAWETISSRPSSSVEYESLAQAMNERRVTRVLRRGSGLHRRHFHLFPSPFLFFMGLRRPRDCRYHQLGDVSSVVITRVQMKFSSTPRLTSS